MPWETVVCFKLKAKFFNLLTGKSEEKAVHQFEAHYALFPQ